MQKVELQSWAQYRGNVPTLRSDIKLLVFTGGQERTNGEYERLFRAADLALASARSAAPPYGVVEARAA